MRLMMRLKVGPGATIVLVVIVVVILLFLVWIVAAFNSLVARQQGVEAQWAQVGNQYQRKIDLIPTLVNVTSRYTQFEANTLTNITALRSRWMNATTIPQQVNLSNLLNLMLANLVLTYEQYPDLHSIGVVAGLFDELAGTENRITVERARYNDAVRSYNTSVRTFPNNLVAGMFGFKDAEYYAPVPFPP